MKSRFLALMLGAALLGAPAVSQAQTIGVMVDGRPVNFGGVPPTRQDGRILVPLRGIFEALGAQVSFNPATNTIAAQRGETQLQVTIGSRQAIVNNQMRLLDVPAQIVSNRTLVPLRFVGEAFGANVLFNDATQTVLVSSPAAPLPAPGITPTPTPPPYTAPGAANMINGTLVNVTGTATVTVTTENGPRVLPLAPNVLVWRQLNLQTAANTPATRGAARQIALSGLASGDAIRLALDETGQVTQIVSSVSAILARVQFSGGNTITLDDERDTLLTVGPNLRFYDAQGRAATTTNLAPGATVALFISPATHSIYAVSASPADLGTAPTNPAPNPAPLPNAGAPQITLIQHNAVRPLKAGTQLQITVRGTAGLRGTFSLLPHVQNGALTENPATPGVYTAIYTVKAGDDVLNGRVSATLTGADGTPDTEQGAQPLTIDTVAPRVLGVIPATGATVPMAQPNIQILGDDLNGSGPGTAQIEITQATRTDVVAATIAPNATVPVDIVPGTTFDIEEEVRNADGSITRTRRRVSVGDRTVAPTFAVNAVPPPLSGPVQVRAVIADKAGNQVTLSFSFTATPNAGGNPIASFTHGATRPVNVGEDVPLVLVAPTGGSASFDVLNGRGTNFVARDVILSEIGTPGRYRGSFRVPVGSPPNLRFVGKYTDAAGVPSTLEAAPVSVGTNANAPAAFSITAPAEGDRIATPLTVSGKASPNAVIEVSVRVEGTRLGVQDYQEELGTIPARADANGNWATAAFNLSKPLFVSNIRYVLTATQTDAANNQGEPFSVTVRLK